MEQSFGFFRKVPKKGKKTVQLFIEIFQRGEAPSPPPNLSSKHLQTELVKFSPIDMLFALISQVFRVKESIFEVKNQKYEPVKKLKKPVEREKKCRTFLKKFQSNVER